MAPDPTTMADPGGSPSRSLLSRAPVRLAGATALILGIAAGAYGISSAATGHGGAGPNEGTGGPAAAARASAAVGGTWRADGPAAGALGTVASVNGSTTSGTCGTAGAAGAFTVEGFGTKTWTVDVTTSTTFEDPAVSSASFADVCVGRSVAAAGTVSSTTVTAARVLVSPAGFARRRGALPWDFVGASAGAFGTVASVNGSTTSGTCGTAGSAGAFTVTGFGAKGTAAQATTVDVTTSTTYQDPAVSSASFADVCVGRSVAAVGSVSSSSVAATKVFVLPAGSGLPGPGPGRFGPDGSGAFGTVASVNGSTTSGTCGTAGAAGAFTVEGFGTKTWTVDVTTSTTFEDPAVSSASFADVCVGRAVVATGTVSSTTVTAARVRVSPAGAGLPGSGPGRFGPGRFGPDGSGAFGTVASVNGSATSGTCGTAGAAGTFTVKGIGAKTWTVDVTTSTTFEDPAVSSASFADVCVGRSVAAAGTVSSTTVTAARVRVAPSFGAPGFGPGRFGDVPGAGGSATVSAV